jgi:transposase InsO family protein
MQRCSRGLRECCRLLGFSRQAYYQYQKQQVKGKFEEDLIIGQVLAHRMLQPRIGADKLHEMLRPFLEEHDIKMGRDLLLDLLRENNLLQTRRKRKQPVTTDSNHWMKKYSNLIKDITLNRADELWVSDITYIRLDNSKFAYLSLITDAYSRKIVGYFLHPNLRADGPVNALKMALDGSTGDQPLIHHSDRGSQYCSDDYVGLLNRNNISISMTQSGNPKDNAIAERVNGILKQELLKESYPNIKQGKAAVATAIDIYNRLRPHHSLNMMTPEKAHTMTGPIARKWRKLIKSIARQPLAEKAEQAAEEQIFY